MTSETESRKDEAEFIPTEVLPPEGKQPASPSRTTRLGVAFGVALVSDLLSAWLEFIPPLQWGLDIVTAGLLFLILGRQWILLPALVAEAIPGIAIFPAWLLVVASIAAWGTVKR